MTYHSKISLNALKSIQVDRSITKIYKDTVLINNAKFDRFRTFYKTLPKLYKNTTSNYIPP